MVLAIIAMAAYADKATDTLYHLATMAAEMFVRRPDTVHGLDYVQPVHHVAVNVIDFTLTKVVFGLPAVLIAFTTLTVYAWKTKERKLSYLGVCRLYVSWYTVWLGVSLHENEVMTMTSYQIVCGLVMLSLCAVYWTATGFRSDVHVFKKYKKQGHQARLHTNAYTLRLGTWNTGMGVKQSRGKQQACFLEFSPYTKETTDAINAFMDTWRVPTNVSRVIEFLLARMGPRFLKLWKELTSLASSMVTFAFLKGFTNADNKLAHSVRLFGKTQCLVLYGTSLAIGVMVDPTIEHIQLAPTVMIGMLLAVCKWLSTMHVRRPYDWSTGPRARLTGTFGLLCQTFRSGSTVATLTTRGTR